MPEASETQILRLPALPHPTDEDLTFTPTSKDRSLGTPSPRGPRFATVAQDDSIYEMNFRDRTLACRSEVHRTNSLKSLDNGSKSAPASRE